DLKFPAQIPHAAGFQLEDAQRVRLIEQVVGFGVVKWKIVNWHFDAAGLPDHFNRVPDDRERFEPQEIHLQQAEVAYWSHGVLGDDDTVLVLLERKQVGER